MHKIKSSIILPLITVVLLFTYCNKNSLQLPENKEANIIKKNIELNNSDIIEVTFKQEVNEIEGKTSLIFRNLSGITITKLKILIEKCNNQNSYKYYDSIINQSIINIDSLHTSKDYTIALPFKTTTLKNDYFNIKLISSNETKQLSSGSFYSVYVGFEKNLLQNFKYGFVNGYITADGSSIIRIKENSNYYFIKANFVDTTIFFNGVMYKPKLNGDSTISTLQDTTVTLNKKYDLSNNGLSFRLKLSSKLVDSTNSLLIKLQKN